MLDLIIIFCAQYLVYLVALVTAAFLAWRFSWQKVATAAISLPVAYGVAKLAGHFYSHIQPFAVQGTTPLIPHVIDNTFPSDHMLLATTLASVVFVYNRRLGILLWVCALAVGLARIVAGLHYPVDIAASAVISVVVVAGVYAALTRFLQQEEHQPHPGQGPQI